MQQIIFRSGKYKDQTPQWLHISQIMLQLIIINLQIIRNQSGFRISDEFNASVLASNVKVLANIAILLSLTLILQIYLKISLIRGIYSILLILAINAGAVTALFIGLFLMVCLTIDVILVTENSFYSGCYLSQKNNIIKVFHYIVAIFCVTLYQVLPSSNLQNIFAFIALLCLYIFRFRNQMNNDRLKKMIEFGYGFGLMGAFWNILYNVFELSIESFVAGMLVSTGILFQLGYTLFGIKFIGSSRLDNSDTIVTVVRNILVYKFNCEYCEEKEFQIKEFNMINREQFDLDVKNVQILDISVYISTMMPLLQNLPKKSISDYMLIAQIQFKILKNFTKALLMLNRLQKKKDISFLELILISKLRYQIQLETNYQAYKHQTIDYVGIIQNDQFVTSLYDISQLYLSLWTNMSDSELMLDKLELQLKSILASNNKIIKDYNSLLHKSQDILLIYCYYKYYVQRNMREAEEAAFQANFYHGIAMFKHKYHHSIVIKISLNKGQEGDILYISPNVSVKLGYNHEDLTRRSINEMLPVCYQKTHQEYLQNEILNMDQSDRFLKFQKTTICKDINDEIFEVDIHLRPHYDHQQNQFYQVGYLMVKDRTFIIIQKNTGQIVHLPQIFKEQITPTNIEELMIVPYAEDTFRKQVEISLGEGIQVNMQLWKTMKTADRQLLILVEKQQQSNQYFEKVNSRLRIKKYPVKKQSSLHSFFQQKSLFLQHLQSFKTDIKILIILVLVIIGLSFIIYNLKLNDQSMKTKEEVGALGMSTQLVQTYARRMMIWMHLTNFQEVNSMPLSYNASIYQDLSSVLNVMQIQTIKVEHLLKDNVTETLPKGLQTYNITMLQMLLSVTKSLKINFNYQSNNNSNIQTMSQSLISYVISNEVEVVEIVLPTLCRNLINYSSNVILNYQPLYLLCMIMIILVMGCIGLVLIIFEYFQNARDFQLIALILSIRQYEVSCFIDTIQLFMFKITSRSSRKPIESSYTYNHIKSDNRSANQQMSILSPSQTFRSAQSSNRLFMKSSAKSKERTQVVIDKQQPLKLKVKPISKLLVLSVLIGFLGITINSVLSFQATLQTRFSLGPYVKNILNLQFYNSLYLQKIEYFLRASENNFTDISNLLDTLADQGKFTSSGAESFDTTLISEQQWIPFLTYYQQLMYKPICNYASCQQYTAQLNQILDSAYLQNSNYLLSMAQSNYNSTNITGILNGSQMTYLVYSAIILSDAILQGISIFYSCLEQHRLVLRHESLIYYWLNLGIFLIFLMTTVLPSIIKIHTKPKMAQQILQLVNQDIYQQ